ncbi:aspartyl aminopeptidase [Sistotremastrum suecicum HHB10207 ss-3]|uniref:aspartyl aminopeptidase n=1 Tax=Sistotremastrum suecicum HHB10207 ss-3 TaxID=1314776 RepID=A0A166HNM4_9AGAM|nr:aspartyl aminopeptidase [Sistotremastrum suecicum HHB10207 ss-3]
MSEAAKRFLSFVNQSPTPFHAVAQAASRLEQAGFRKSSIMAFTIPKNWRPGTGLSIVATHIDSPNLRIRPISKKTKDGYLQVGVETYGGGLWHTWLDRDLSIAGRVILGSSQGSNYHSKLIKIDRPILRIPNLAIHLDRTVNDNFKFNKETEMVPILGLVSAQLNASKNSESALKDGDIQSSTAIQDHHPELISLLCEETGLSADDIYDFELHLYDTQLSTIGGIHNEFIFSPRLDNQLSSFCAVDSLIAASSGSANVNVAALFNHEEIGSVSTTGAESSLIPSLISRLSPSPAAEAESIAKSFVISADMGHAIHPNYASKHEDQHKPKMNGGIVVKTNAKQRYASDAIGTFLIRKLVSKKGGKIQQFEVRNDMACGSTVGPMLSKLGLRTVDVGMAQLAMHSIRETCGSQDVQAYIDLFTAFFEDFTTFDTQLSVD